MKSSEKRVDVKARFSPEIFLGKAGLGRTIVEVPKKHGVSRRETLGTPCSTFRRAR